MINKIYHDAVYYHGGTNLSQAVNLVRPNIISIGKPFKVKHQIILLLSGLNEITTCLKSDY